MWSILYEGFLKHFAVCFSKDDGGPPPWRAIVSLPVILFALVRDPLIQFMREIRLSFPAPR